VLPAVAPQFAPSCARQALAANVRGTASAMRARWRSVNQRQPRVSGIMFSASRGQVRANGGGCRTDPVPTAVRRSLFELFEEARGLSLEQRAPTWLAGHLAHVHASP
jgi:hypothetical protein